MRYRDGVQGVTTPFDILSYVGANIVQIMLLEEISRMWEFFLMCDRSNQI